MGWMLTTSSWSSPGNAKREHDEVTMTHTTHTYDPVAGEEVEVPDHAYNVPEDKLPMHLDDGRVLVRSEMSADPIEGVQGSYTIVDPDKQCPRCGIPGVRLTVITLDGEHMYNCAHCGWSQV